MKKIITLVLAVLMVAGCAISFASCSKGTDFEQIQEKGKFVCGITIYEPMNYYEGGVEDMDHLTGFDTELAKLVAEKLDLEVEFQIIDWGQKYSELASGAIDCIWNGFTSNSKDDDGVDRADKVDFTYAYLDNAQCVIVKSGDVASYTSAESLAGKKAAVEEGSAGASYADSVGATLVQKTSQMDTFIDLKSGAVDFVVVDVLLAQKIVGQGNFADLTIATAIEIEPEVYSIGCRKNSDFDEKINEALLELLNDGTIEALAAKYDVHVTKSLLDMKEE